MTPDCEPASVLDAGLVAGDCVPGVDADELVLCGCPEDCEEPDGDWVWVWVWVWLGDDVDCRLCDCDGVDCGMLLEEVDCAAQDATSTAPISAPNVFIRCRNPRISVGLAVIVRRWSA